MAAALVIVLLPATARAATLCGGEQGMQVVEYL